MQQSQNPLLAEWRGPYGLPPFGEIVVDHYRQHSSRRSRSSCRDDRIAGNPQAADFDNTIAALERSGRSLQQVGAVFWNFAGRTRPRNLRKLSAKCPVRWRATQANVYER